MTTKRELTREDIQLITKVMDRADSITQSLHGDDFTPVDRPNSLVDMISAVKTFDLDLEAWLAIDDVNFMHDFIGVKHNINRSSFDSNDFNGFLPRIRSMKQIPNK